MLETLEQGVKDAGSQAANANNTGDTTKVGVSPTQTPEAAAAGAPTVQPTIPKERLDEVLDKKRELEIENRILQEHINRNQVPVAKPPQPKEIDIYEQLGLTEDDVPTVKQQRVIDAYRERKVQQALYETQFLVGHPDFHDVVVNSEEFKNLVKSDPTCVNLIRNSGDPLTTAYVLGKMAKKVATSSSSAKPNAAIEAALQLADKAKAPTSAASAGANAPISKLNEVKNMTDEQIRQRAEAIINRRGR